MTTDVKWKKKKQVRHSDEGKSSKKESDYQRGHFYGIYGRCGPAIIFYRQ